MPEILKKSSKSGDRLTAISDLQNNECGLFQARNRQPSQQFPEKVFQRNSSFLANQNLQELIKGKQEYP